MTNDIIWLNNGEVLSLLDERMSHTKYPTVNVARITYDYCSKFTTVYRDNSIKNIKHAHNTYYNKLNSEQLMLLINLFPSSVEEARALIPSLSSIDDTLLESLILELENFQ